MDKELDGLVKQYVLQSLELNATRLRCINLGWTSNKDIGAELSLIKMAKEKIEEIW